MSLAKGETFESTLEAELKEAGLPSDPSEVIGRVYRFGCEYGSHHTILVGTVVAIQLSDEGGLVLFVSSPRLGNIPLHSICCNNGRWSAYVPSNKPDPRDDISKISEGYWNSLSEAERDRLSEAGNACRWFEGEFQLL